MTDQGEQARKDEILQDKIYFKTKKFMTVVFPYYGDINIEVKKADENKWESVVEVEQFTIRMKFRFIFDGVNIEDFEKIEEEKKDEGPVRDTGKKP